MADVERGVSQRDVPGVEWSATATPGAQGCLGRCPTLPSKCIIVLYPTWLTVTTGVLPITTLVWYLL